MLRFVPILLLLCTTSCASILEGTSQKITVATIPSGARCVAERGGAQIGIVDTTPGVFTVSPKNSVDIQINCTKTGFLPVVYKNKSDQAAAVYGNILAGGIIGILVDQSNGASYKYEGAVSIPMLATPEVAEAPVS